MRAWLRLAVLRSVVALMVSASLSSNVRAAEDESQVPESEVQVVGSRQTRDETEPEVASSVVMGDSLHQPGLELAEALRGEGSVQVNQTGGAADLSTISIRGASAAQVPVYLAGIRINDDVVGVADLSAVPSWMIRRATVYQSAPPLHLARSGFAGAVVIDPRLPIKSEGFLSAEAGSFSSGALGAGLSYAHAGMATSLSVRRSAARNDYTYPNDNGTAFVKSDDTRTTRKNADYTQSDVWWITRLIERGVHVHLIGQLLLREQGVTGLSLVPAESARSALDRALFGLSASIPCKVGGVDCRVKLVTAGSQTVLETRDPKAELFIVPGEVRQNNQRLTQDLRVTIETPHSLKIEGSLAAEASRLGSDTEPSDALARRAHEFFMTGELSAGQRLADMVFLRGAARYQCLRAEGTDQGYLDGVHQASVENTQCLPGARFGISVEPTPSLTLRSSAIYGARYPTLGERFGVSASMRGNPDLNAEQGFGVDVGASWSKQVEPVVLSIESNAYARRTDHIIAYQRVSLGYVRPFNLQEGRFRGGDVSIALDAWDKIRVSGQLSLLDAQRFEDGDKKGPIPFQSALSGQMELYAHTGQLTHDVSDLGLRLIAYYRGKRYADPAGLIVIPDQATLDGTLNITVKEALDLRFRVENLTNSARFDALGYPLPGRGYYLGLEARL